MSTGADELMLRSRPAALRASSIGFIALLLLALVWPAPVVWLNEATFNASIGVDERSFLGREAPSWDVVFWAIAGIFALSLLHGRIDQAQASLRTVITDLRSVRRNAPSHLRHLGWPVTASIALGIAAVAGMWILLDSPLIATAELADSDRINDVARLANRLGGGMNPTMIIIFFGFAGIIFVHHRWVHFAVAMTLSALAAGLVAQILKFVVSRSRPELWLGAFDHTGPLAGSFPSGHTVSAFAIASVLLFGSRSPALRIISMVLAILVAASRVLSFRHWPSDVFASALLGLLFGWFFITAIQRNGETDDTQP